MSDLVFGILSTTLIILLLICGLVIAFFVMAKQRAQQEKVLIESKLSFEKELRQVETEVTEQIMSQFGQELHDNIGQMLTAVHIQMENMKIDHPALLEGFKPMDVYLGEVRQQLRLLSRALNNDYLGNAGLIATVQQEVERLRSLKRVAFHIQAPEGETNLSKDQELMTFRIFQELTQNMLRHSGARNYYITIRNQDGGFSFTAEDDGRGFDASATLASPKASGLRNIIKRAKLAGLECAISSSEGKTAFVLTKNNN